MAKNLKHLANKAYKFEKFLALENWPKESGQLENPGFHAVFDFTINCSCSSRKKYEEELEVIKECRKWITEIRKWILHIVFPVLSMVFSLMLLLSR